MDEMAKSLQKFRYTKEIKKSLASIDPMLINNKDLSAVFVKLFEEQLISENDLMALNIKFKLSQFTSLMEHNFTGLKCGIYLYDEDEKRLWNGATSRVSNHYNEYSNGLSAVNDIAQGDDIPLYVKGIIPIPDVARGEDIISLNHKADLLKSGYHSICCSPVKHGNVMIGHTVMFSEKIKTFTIKEMRMFSRYNHLIEGKLMHMKHELISLIKKTNIG
ncbi:hypothetical protein JOC77_000603 [Peribacillus deserti]|uniref:GAF domain-containing protein n=1 Tax=Peribacillus deserti TaxID=673318 RepID=A0ABS2QDI5_9BACI|nr:hypothetical protein [Peribacillus deserti]MBM7691198.1 hypothetical protein [Peribacillus deserti]